MGAEKCDQKGELPMPTQEERLTTLEKTVALLQKSSSTGIQELNRNVTMLLGIVSSQQLDIKEIKISLITVEERLDTMDQRIDTLGRRLDTLEQHMDSRFDALEKKFDQLVTTLTTRPEQ